MAIKKFKVTASAEANTKKSVKADKSINERTDDLNRLKQIISDYCENEFGQKVDFSDLKDVGMGYTTYGDYDEWSLEVTADLENCKLIYTTIYPDGTYAENVEQYKDWGEMANVLEDVTFDNLMSLQYFPDLCEDEYLNASCGKKSIKSSSAKAKGAVKAGTTPRDNVKPLSVGQARVFTYRGDSCVFVGVPNGMIFRWYPGNYEAKGELNYAKTVIKKYPNEWEKILREYGFDQYDANAEYQTLSAKNPVKASTESDLFGAKLKYNETFAEGPYAAYASNANAKAFVVHKFVGDRVFPDGVEKDFPTAMRLAKKYNVQSDYEINRGADMYSLPQVRINFKNDTEFYAVGDNGKQYKASYDAKRKVMYFAVPDSVEIIGYIPIESACGKKSVNSSTKRKPMNKTIKASEQDTRSEMQAYGDSIKDNIKAIADKCGYTSPYAPKVGRSNLLSDVSDYTTVVSFELNEKPNTDGDANKLDRALAKFFKNSGYAYELVDKTRPLGAELLTIYKSNKFSTKKTVKASASAKRRAAKRITASDASNDIVMYFNGDNVYQGSVYDLADAVENLCYDEDVNAKFQEWCNQFGDPFDFDGSPIDTAAVFTDIIIQEADEAEKHSDFYEDGNGILDFEIFYADDAVEGSVKRSVKASIDSDYDTKVLRELEDYIKDNYPLYVDTEYAVYENENDWSVGLFASIGMVESDFEYFLNEQNPYLYNRLTETGLIGGPSVNNAVGANDFQFQLYPTQNQWRGPQLDIDETNLANAGDDGSVYAELKTQIDAFEIMYINALQELNYHMGDLLREYDEGQGIHASTDVNADLQLNKYPGDRKKYSYNKNSITDIDGYVQDIADGVVEKFPDLEYEISDEAITFTRDGNVIYVQAIDEIVPERDDLNDDIDELASAIQMDDELNAMREDFDAGWNASYDSDTATRAVEMSVNDDLEPIMGDDYEEEDMGFGFTTSGEAISESMVDELCRIANEILEKSELAKYDEYTSIDRDTFDYWCNGSTYVSEKFYIYFTFTQNGGWFINNDMVDFSDSRGISEAEEFTFECDISIKDGEVVEVLYNDMPDNYSADMIDVPALTEYIEKLAAPVARDIYNGTTNI